MIQKEQIRNAKSNEFATTTHETDAIEADDQD